jgi:D-alanyl-D-alanine carboxypeptidase
LSTTLDIGYLAKLAALHKRLGLEAALLEEAELGMSDHPLCGEAMQLVSIGGDVFGRPQQLAPDAARAWAGMLEAATSQGISLQLVSGFRGIDYQAELIGRKLSAGQCLSDILKVSAAPGFSEHHTGNAVDVTTEGAAALDETFDNTDCFHWLLARAGDFGFTLTYPRDNSFGIDYEPWHWCFQSQERSRAR